MDTIFAEILNTIISDIVTYTKLSMLTSRIIWYWQGFFIPFVENCFSIVNKFSLYLEPAKSSFINPKILKSDFAQMYTFSHESRVMQHEMRQSVVNIRTGPAIQPERIRPRTYASKMASFSRAVEYQRPSKRQLHFHKLQNTRVLRQVMSSKN